MPWNKVPSVVTLIKLEKQFRPPPPSIILGGDLLSPGIYQTLSLFVTRYRQLGLLPCSFSMDEKKMKIDLTRVPFIPKISSIWTLGHTLLCLVFLLQKLLSQKKPDFSNPHADIEVARMFNMFFLFIFPSSMMASSFLISWTPLVPVNIMNTIRQLENSIRGKSLYRRLAQNTANSFG